jgi:hypothetical protein
VLLLLQHLDSFAVGYLEHHEPAFTQQQMQVAQQAAGVTDVFEEAIAEGQVESPR